MARIRSNVKRGRPWTILTIIAAVIVVSLLGTAVATASLGGVTDGTQFAAEENDTDVSPAQFEITGVETNTPVKAGETIEVTVDVSNTGGEAGQSDVSFSLDQYLKDETTVQLEPNESTTVTLSYVSKSRDDGTWDMTVRTADDSDQRQITITDPSESSGSSGGSGSGSGSGTGYTYSGTAVFEVTAFEVDAPVKAGEPLRMNATVENTGTASGEKLLWFEINDHTIDETVVSLSPGEERTVNFTFNTSMDGHGMHDLAAVTPDDSVTEEIELIELESEFAITDVGTNNPIPAGDELLVTVEVSNVGDIEGSKNVWLFLDGYLIDERTLDLAANESTTVELRYITNEWNLGELEFTVATQDAEAAFSAVVDEPAETPTPTATEATPSEEPRTESTAEPTTEPSTPTEESTPGFGVVVALVALLGAAGLLVGRRR